MNKKVCIATFHKTINYGAFFQCYALQKKLELLNYDVFILDYENKADKEKYALINKKSIKKLISSLIFMPVNAIKKKAFRKCTTKYLKYGKTNNKYDIAISGSDQIWNPLLTGGKLDPIFFLETINAKKKISYASSIGNEYIVDEYSNEYKDYLKKYSHISVREEKAKKALEKNGVKGVKVVLDPTLLLSRDEWMEIVPKKLHSDEYIFSYFVGPTNKQYRALETISKKIGLKVASYSKIPKEKNIWKYCYMDGPIDFLAKLNESKLVVTSSFHGIALSIALRKNFYCLMPKKQRRSRIDNILNKLGLEDRIIETEDDLKNISLADIDYDVIQEKLDKLKEESTEWLIDSLEK